MAYKEIDPDREPRLSDPVARGDEQSGMALVGVVAAIAVLMIAGLVYFNLGGETTTTSNTSPGVTTGSSPPSAPNPAEQKAPADR